MAAQPPNETIFDEREESLVSSSGGNPTRRIGHFLKPTLTSIDASPIFNPPSHSLSAATSQSTPPVNVAFKGWRNPPRKWRGWVDQLQTQHQSVWIQAGIHDAIVNSTYLIHRDAGLVHAVAEKWCPETNSFVFPWGESTMTLEDMMVLGGYSVLGHPVSSPLDSSDLCEIKEKLVHARSQVTRTTAARASQSVWMTKFMGSGSEIEHEAFLALWLSRFVFPTRAFDTINKSVFPIAIHLARGTKIAVAPAVLASIYRDLSFLKQSHVGFKSVEVWSPFQLLQIWAWERFPKLRANPNTIGNGEPRLALWHKVKIPKPQRLGVAIDSEGECFLWRPYAKVLNNGGFPKFYRENEEWVSVGPHLDEELESFARCLRVSELVGVDSCVEQYLPHRVAMQFGMDQDIPGNVVRSNATPEIAWGNYEGPIRDEKLYIPPRLFESDVTVRYLEWWKKSKEPRKVGVGKKNNDEKKGLGIQVKSCDRKMGCNHPLVPPGFSPKNTAKNDPTVPPGFFPKNTTKNDPTFPPGFFPRNITKNDSIVPPKYIVVEEIKDSVDEDEHTSAEIARKTREGKRLKKSAHFQIPPPTIADNESPRSKETEIIIID